MKTKKNIIFLITLSFLVISCTGNSSSNIDVDSNDKAIIKFLELGAESCHDCIEMQPVMDSIRKKYGEQIDVIFIDLFKNYSYIEKYNVEVMPTQVFLDSNDVEIHRHQGFYSEDSIHIFLNSQGLTKIY